MHLHYTGKYFFLFFLFVLGCAYPVAKKPAPPSPELAAPQKGYEVTFREEAQKEKLQRSIPAWEEGHNTLIDSLVAGEDNRSAIEKILLSDKEDDIAKKRRFFSYLGKLKQIKILQQRLKTSDTALSRETTYMELIDHYLFCLKLLEEIRAEHYVSGFDSTKIKKVIENNYQNGNFYKVIALHRYLEQGKTDGGRDLKSHVYYALSLIQLGLTEDALKAAEDALGEDFFITSENASQMFKLGEWLIDMEQYEVAERFFQRIIQFYRTEEEWHKKAETKAALFSSDIQYLKVRNKLDQAIDLFEKRGKFSVGYLLCREAQKRCPDLACREEVQDVLNQFVTRTVADIEERLFRIDEKIGESEILEARVMLLSLEESFPGEDYPPPVIEMLALIQEKEKFFQEEEVRWKDELDIQKLEKANNFLESEHFEEAIRLFDQLEGTPYQIEAATKKQLAIDGFARDNRTKAGQLFFDAKHSEDPEIKKTYFIESYNLLKNVIQCCPNNRYAEKIRKNLEDVRLEIEKIYPEFFLEEESEEEYY